METRFSHGKIRCVIYDCDGVLFDSYEANTRLYNDFCKKMGREPLRPEEMDYVHAHTVYEAIHSLFGRDREMEKRALEFLKQLDLREYIDYLKMEPHLLETLKRLKENEMMRAICTNRTTSMKHIMGRFQLWPYFEMVVTALDVKHPKPHPESVRRILEAFHLSEEETVFVGDSEVDQQTAESSGVQFIAYKNREIRHHVSIEDHLDLLNHLGIGNP